MSLRLMLPLAAALSLTLPLQAQDSTLSPGTRVRVLSACDTTGLRTGCDALKGRLLLRTGSELLIQDADGAEHRVTLSPGVRVQLSAGYRRHTLLGLGIGSAVGLVTGAALVSNCTQGGEDDGLCYLRLIIAAPTGAAAGTLVGALIRSERWKDVPDPRTSLQIRPMDGGTALRLAFSF